MPRTSHTVQYSTVQYSTVQYSTVQYSTEEDDSGIHLAYYDVNERNFTNLHLTKEWSSDDYLKHADGRPVEG